MGTNFLKLPARSPGLAGSCKSCDEMSDKRISTEVDWGRETQRKIKKIRRRIGPCPKEERIGGLIWGRGYEGRFLFDFSSVSLYLNLPLCWSFCRIPYYKTICWGLSKRGEHAIMSAANGLQREMGPPGAAGSPTTLRRKGCERGWRSDSVARPTVYIF